MIECNPHVVEFLRLHKLPPDTIDRVDGEIRVIELKGTSGPWTLYFIAWICRKWDEWGRSLGFYGERGWGAHSVAMRHGHTAEDFQRWLAAREEP